MKLEVLMSCMHQKDESLLKTSRLTGDVVIINQCDWEDYAEYPTETGTARMFSVRQRGLTKSRNLATEKSLGDICLLCDDDEVFVPDYEAGILDAYEKLPQADVLIFNMANHPISLPNRVMKLRFPQTMKVCSWQISFRRERLRQANVRFDELLGAGTGNGGEEELKFLTDCEKAGLSIYYVPFVIASVAQESSTWFHGFTEQFFENRGATTRYILGSATASAYALYYIVRKRKLYRQDITPAAALKATFRGIRENKIEKQAKRLKEPAVR